MKLKIGYTSTGGLSIVANTVEPPIKDTPINDTIIKRSIDT